MKIKGYVIENAGIAKKLAEQKGNESLKAKIQSLLQLEACKGAKAGYLAEERIAKLRTVYLLKPTITWELVKVESGDGYKPAVAAKHLPELKQRTVH